MRWLLAVALLAGCSAGDGGLPPEGVQTAVVDRIQASDDCEALQSEFDQAMDNAEAREAGDPARDVSLYYAQLADEQMAEVGCYD